MVLEERLRRGLVRREAREPACCEGRGDRAVVRREEREAVQAPVQHIEEWRGGARVGVQGGEGDVAEEGREEREGGVVERDGLRERAGEAEDVVDRVDGDVAERRRVRHRRIVPVVRFPLEEPISVRERDSGEGNAVMIGAARGRELTVG